MVLFNASKDAQTDVSISLYHESYLMQIVRQGQRENISTLQVSLKDDRSYISVHVLLTDIITVSVFCFIRKRNRPWHLVSKLREKMYERRSSIHSDVRNDDNDERLLELTTASSQGHERILLNVLDEPTGAINGPDEKESDTELLLDDAQPVLPPTGTIRCADAPARYIIAIWAFFGFLCLYATRVNLSVAVVAMVRIPIIRNSRIRFVLLGSTTKCFEPIHRSMSSASEKFYRTSTSIYYYFSHYW